MITESKFVELMVILQYLGVEEALKRLERGGGSGAASCFADREASGKQDREEEEERSDEPKELAVSPGLARDALQWAVNQASNAAVDRDNRARSCAFRGLSDGESFHKGQAARFRSYGEALAVLVPKPDSEQGENAGDGKPSQEPVEAGADSNCGTASGRRTLKVCRTRKETTMSETDKPKESASPTCSLLPCPFCGEPGALHKGGDPSYPLWIAHCSNDKINLSDGGCMVRPSTPPRYVEGSAERDWNRRANTDVDARCPGTTNQTDG